MKLIGDLVLAGLGQIKALRVDNLLEDPVSASTGQIWYNSSDGFYKGWDGTKQITFATGGATGDILSEVNLIETGAGLQDDGRYVFPANTNYLATAISLKNADVLLDAAIKAVVDNLVITDGKATDLLAEVGFIETAVGLDAGGKFISHTGTNYINGATTVFAVDVALDTAAKAALDSGYAANTNANTRVSKAGDVMTGNLIMTTGFDITLPDNATAGTDAVNLNTLQTYTAQLRYRVEAAARDTASLTLPAVAPLVIDTHTVLDGDRVLFTGLTAGNNEVYVAKIVNTAVTWVAEKDFGRTGSAPLEGDTIVISYGDVYKEAGYTWNTSGWVQFNGGTQVMPGVGLLKNGNVLSVKLGAAISELPTNEVGVDILSTGGLFTTVDGSTSSTATAAQLSIKLNSKDSDTLELSSDGLRVKAKGITGVELNASVAGAGLAGGAGAPLSIGTGDGITINPDGIQFDSAWGDLRYLNTDGDTLTGDLILFGDTTNALGAVTKQFVDALSTRVNNGTFVYISGAASAQHVVTHNLGNKFNTVTVYDSADKVIIPDSIVADSTTALTVGFASSITCKVVVSGVKVAA